VWANSCSQTEKRKGIIPNNGMVLDQFGLRQQRDTANEIQLEKQHELSRKPNLMALLRKQV